MKLHLRRSLGWITSIGFIAVVLSGPAYSQVLPKNRAKSTPATPAPAAAPAPAVVPAPAVTPAPAPTVAPAPAPVEPAGQTRREGRQEARETRAEARQEGAPRPEAREAARETRQQTRQNMRAADYGVWFATGGNRGLIIDDLSDNGMFASAGFRAGDQIVSINGQAVTSEAQFVQLLAAPSNQPIEIIVIRNGQRQTLVLQATAVSQGVVNYDPFYQFGIVVDDGRPDQIVVQRVYPRTPAYYAGLRQGDVITTVGGQRIASVNAFSQALVQSNNAIDLGITRSGQTRQIQMDAANVNVEGSARTALRPNLDADARIDARADVREGAAATTQVDRNPDTRTAPPRDADARNPARRADDRNPPAPDAAPPAPRSGDAPQRPNPPSGTTPATPATPANPGVAPATPATPATPDRQPRTEGSSNSAPAPVPAAPKGAK